MAYLRRVDLDLALLSPWGRSRGVCPSGCALFRGYWLPCCIAYGELPPWLRSIYTVPVFTGHLIGCTRFHTFPHALSPHSGAGLALTYVALVFSWFGDQGQPALLYLVPCTLGTTLVLG